MKQVLIPMALISLSIMSCGDKPIEQNNTTMGSTNVDTISTKITESTSDNDDKVDISNIFEEFPKMSTTAQVGDVVMVPSYKMLQRFMGSGKQQSTLIYYNAVMVKPGAHSSTIKFTFDGEKEVPNHMFVPIPSGQKVQKGDIILTWWQSGSGMKRAIVTNASNPAAPEVNYIDIDWNNPAQNGGKSIGQMTETIAANSFVKLSNEWQAGTTIAVREGANYKKATIINVNENKILIDGFAGSAAIYDKANCTPVPIKVKVKKGDTVFAPFVGTYKQATVVKEIPDMGRVVVRFNGIDDKDYYIAMGDILISLP